jgi:hypothetical protein
MGGFAHPPFANGSHLQTVSYRGEALDDWSLGFVALNTDTGFVANVSSEEELGSWPKENEIRHKNY